MSSPPPNDVQAPVPAGKYPRPAPAALPAILEEEQDEEQQDQEDDEEEQDNQNPAQVVIQVPQTIIAAQVVPHALAQVPPTINAAQVISHVLTQAPPPIVAAQVNPHSPRTIIDLPREMLSGIFEFYYESIEDWEPRVVVVDEQESKTAFQDTFSPLLSNKTLRASGLLVFVKKHIFKARVESVGILHWIIRPDMLESIKVLHLHSTASASGIESGTHNILAYHRHKLSGPGALVSRMGSLKEYTLEIELGYIRLQYSAIGQLLAARGADVNVPFSSNVIFRHYSAPFSSARSGSYTRHRFKRSWAILFPPYSHPIRIERLLQMEELNLFADSIYQPRELQCGNCFDNGDVVRDFQQRVICPECEMAVYCCQDCLDEDFDRHQLNECTFDLHVVGNNLDNFAGQQPGIQDGYTCDMVATIWGKDITTVWRQ